ncbi:MAG: 4Fe-4S dicluster domain-containing protein [Magnetococcales bacterium]|nr:4Fe-4S dicluster domain-containing protein [Magnetococcales bacterium]
MTQRHHATPHGTRAGERTTSRRTFLRQGVLGLSGVLGAVGIGYWPRVSRAAPPLRPPGAVTEEAFLGRCIKCGLCAQSCPVQAIRLGDMAMGFGIGTAHIASREQSCGFSCDALECVRACPTGALRHQVVKMPRTSARMGLAVLADPDACLRRRTQPLQGLARQAGFQGRLRRRWGGAWQVRALDRTVYERESCDLCVLECPIPQAIRMDSARPDPATGRLVPMPTVLANCLGCGVCEMVCPTEPASIRIHPGLQPDQGSGSRT